MEVGETVSELIQLQDAPVNAQKVIEGIKSSEKEPAGIQGSCPVDTFEYTLKNNQDPSFEGFSLQKNQEPP
jgi:hypothetical protein